MLSPSCFWHFMAIPLYQSRRQLWSFFNTLAYTCSYLTSLCNGLDFKGWTVKEQFGLNNGILILHTGCLTLPRGPPVNVLILRTGHCINIRDQPCHWCWWGHVCVPRNFLSRVGNDPEPSSMRGQCTNHCLLEDSSGGVWVWQRCSVSYVTRGSNWYWLTVGQGLLSM